MERLTTRRLGTLPATVRTPRYDRDRLEIGLAHIGVGAFHRCHLAEYTDDMLEAAFGRWGSVGINIRPPRLADSLGAQDGLYTRTLRTGASAQTRVIGCIRRVIDVESPLDAASAIDAIASPHVGTVTLTLTEKGYCHMPATGVLDPRQTDVIHDLAAPPQPRTALGLLAAAFERRMLVGAGPLSVVSCDNLPSNGALLARVMSDFVAARPAALRRWMADNIAFPGTMVDRIVPATTSEDIAFASGQLGAADQAAVVGEPFRQWVLSDGFAGERPPWDLAGAQFVPNVQPYELVKMRVLNAAQSTLSHLGPFLGHDFSFQAAADPLLARYVRRMLTEETAPTLANLDGMPTAAYIDTTFQRIGNPAIRHRCHQIGTDGSQKIVQRLINPMRERLAAGRPAPLLTLAIAAWVAYVLAGAALFGRRWSAIDPFASQVVALSDGCQGDLVALANRILSIGQIFGTLAPNDQLCATVARHIAGLHSRAPRDYLLSVLDL